ncbi:MAG: hypothetical protein IJN69_04940 [Oscillospiraceae bacterium]|nr:hypothetical protein [Oscillospiraceae bacterium]
MKKFSVILAASVIVLSVIFTGCEGEKTAEGSQKSLYSHGLDLVEMVEEMAKSEAYLEIYTGSPRISEVVSGFGSGDYSVVKKVYKLTPTEAYLAEYGTAAEMSGLSSKVKKTVSDKTIAAIVTQINAMGGAENLAATTVCTAGKTFVSSELKETCVWIYVFEYGFPVAVTFTPGEDSTVSASAMLVSCEEFPVESAQDIEEFLGGGIKAEDITE